MGAEMATRHAIRVYMFERLDDRVDHRRKWRWIHEHRCGRVRTDQLAGRQHKPDGTKGAFVCHFGGAHEIFERDARDCLPATEIAGIDRPLGLGGNVTEIDSEFIARDDHLYLDRHWFITAGAV